MSGSSKDKHSNNQLYSIYEKYLHTSEKQVSYVDFLKMIRDNQIDLEEFRSLELRSYDDPEILSSIGSIHSEEVDSYLGHIQRNSLSSSIEAIRAEEERRGLENVSLINPIHNEPPSVEMPIDEESTKENNPAKKGVCWMCVFVAVLVILIITLIIIHLNE